MLEKGVSALYELLFYSIVIGIPLFELYKGAVSTHLKEQQLLQNIGALEDQLQALNRTLGTALAMAKSKNNDALQVVDQRRTALQ